MPCSKLALASIVVSLLAFGPPAFAATAHNLQTGAQTSNANDSAADAKMKQMKHGKSMKRMKAM